MEAVRQLLAFITRDGLLPVDPAGGRPRSERGSGGGPGTEGGSLEVLEDGAGGRGVGAGSSEVNVVPSKSPTKYCPPDPPAMLPGLRLTTITHLTLRGLPSTASGNRSGHSHTPPTAPAGPKSDRWVHCFRLASGRWRPSARRP